MRTSKENSYKFWDRVSGWSKAESAANSTLVKYLDSELNKYVRADDNVLDYGCGTGTITLRMAGLAGSVKGVDVSECMLARAKQNLERQNLQNAAFGKISSLDKMFSEGSFQVVTCFNVLQYIENREELFGQFHGLLGSRGTLIVAAPCFGDSGAFSYSYLKFLRLVRIMPQTYIFSAGEFEREIIGAGFNIAVSINLSNLPEKLIVARREL